MAKKKVKTGDSKGNISSPKQNEKNCFVISPIGETKSEIRKNANQVYNYLILPVVSKHGYKTIRADKIAEPGIITNQIIQCIVESDLIIADLTGNNANVFYELAIRHAIKKPLIHLIKKGNIIPFDVAGTRTIQYDLSDLDCVEEVKKSLEKNIENINKSKEEIDTPISVALDLKAYKQSEKPIDKSIADIYKIMSDINDRITSINSKIPSRIFSHSSSDSPGVKFELPQIKYNWETNKGTLDDYEREYDASRNCYIYVPKEKAKNKLFDTNIFNNKFKF